MRARLTTKPAPPSFQYLASSKMSEPVSRVLSRVIIYLGRTLLRGSCGDTREVSGQLQSSPIRPCSRWGLPSLRLTTELVVSYTTVSAFLSLRRGFSFLWHFPYTLARTVAASNHLALWSPDFPLRQVGAITQLAQCHGTTMGRGLQCLVRGLERDACVVPLRGSGSRRLGGRCRWGGREN